ncbi:NADAR family protein [Micromonospora sp. NPDC005194]|uniref:NADAR family protein n=1 Tax=Micromonospora sp. NPDC005194 TaxID=3156870 RepID=UPI0033A9E350
MATSLSSVAELTGEMRSGARVKFLFFWGHQPQRDGAIGAGCLSQWWPAPFTIDGLRFPTTEHYMMWRKATLFGDQATAAQILTVRHPHAAKTLGRQVASFDQQVWEQHRYDVVVTGSAAKFGQHPALRTYLLGTRERVLVEASPLDRVWGIGLTADHPHAADPARWRGLNLLGFALMQTRATLLEQEPTDG